MRSIPTSCIELTHSKIATENLVPSPADTRSGGTVVFVGTAREFTDGRETSSLAYEAYETMALKALQKLADVAQENWPIVALRLIHRLGPIALGEACVAIVVSCPHRCEAFAATAWLMDRIKEDVPIWKQEIWKAGNSEWVHPDTPAREK